MTNSPSRLIQTPRKIMWNRLFNNPYFPVLGQNRRTLPYRNQSIYLLGKSIEWFLYDRDLRFCFDTGKYGSAKTHISHILRSEIPHHLADLTFRMCKSFWNNSDSELLKASTASVIWYISLSEVAISLFGKSQSG